MADARNEPPAAVGLAEIDGEHRMQLGLISALRQAVAEKRDRTEVGEILDRLVEFTKVHFMSEQLLMRLHSDPDYEAHVQEHERAVERLEQLEAGFRDGDAGLSLNALDSLHNWLTAHMLDSDRALGRRLTGLGHGS